MGRSRVVKVDELPIVRRLGSRFENQPSKGKRKGDVFALRMTDVERGRIEARMEAAGGPRSLGPWLVWFALNAVPPERTTVEKQAESQLFHPDGRPALPATDWTFPANKPGPGQLALPGITRSSTPAELSAARATFLASPWLLNRTNKVHRRSLLRLVKLREDDLRKAVDARWKKRGAHTARRRKGSK